MRIDGRANTREPGMITRSLRKTRAGVLTNSRIRPNDPSKFPKNKKHLSISEDSMNNGRVSTEELSKAITEFAKHIPPISEQDVSMVKMNPGLLFIQKLRIIRKMRKTIKESRYAGSNP